MLFETKNTITRDITNFDFAEITLLFSSKEFEEYIGSSLNYKQIVEWIEFQKKYHQETGLGFLSVLDRTTGGFIGLISIYPTKINEHDTAIMKFFLKNKNNDHDKNIITEAIPKILKYIYQNYDFKGVIITNPYKNINKDINKKLQLQEKLFLYI